MGGSFLIVSLGQGLGARQGDSDGPVSSACHRSRVRGVERAFGGEVCEAERVSRKHRSYV